MDEVVLRDYFDPVPRRDTRKRLARIEQEAMVRRAAIAAAARDAVQQVGTSEHLGQYKAQLKVNGIYDLAELATYRSTLLDHSIAHNTHGNPGLELIQRGFEDTAALAARVIIYNDGTR